MFVPTALRLRQLFIRIFNLSNLSCGRRNWRDSESISMPRNVSWHVGPTIFSGANGTPSSLQVSMIWLQSCRSTAAVSHLVEQRNLYVAR